MKEKYTTKRTNYEDTDFQILAAELDKDLAIKNEESNSFFKHFNQIDSHKNEAINLYKKYNFRITANYGQYKNIQSSICFEKSIDL